jgi:hypothetical protein
VARIENSRTIDRRGERHPLSDFLAVATEFAHFDDGLFQVKVTVRGLSSSFFGPHCIL